jgi:hypothetical protein
LENPIKRILLLPNSRTILRIMNRFHFIGSNQHLLTQKSTTTILHPSITSQSHESYNTTVCHKNQLAFYINYITITRIWMMVCQPSHTFAMFYHLISRKRISENWKQKQFISWKKSLEIESKNNL